MYVCMHPPAASACHTDTVPRSSPARRAASALDLAAAHAAASTSTEKAQTEA